MTSEPTFPIYRRYKNHHSYFRIDSPESFTELKRLPGGWKAYEFKARILPDRNYIHDMIYEFEEHWEDTSEDDYKRIEEMITGQ